MYKTYNVCFYVMLKEQETFVENMKLMSRLTLKVCLKLKIRYSIIHYGTLSKENE